MATCKGCGKKIIWIGKMPCDPDQIIYRQEKRGNLKVVTQNGEVLSAVLFDNPETATGIGYISHFATCPKADQFRRRGRE